MNMWRSAGLKRFTVSVAMTAVLVLCAAPASATRISDVTHLKGARTNRLVGLGLVTGLAGKGDGGKFQPAMRPLSQILRSFNNESSLEELKDASNVAIVSIEVVLPEHGVREGDSLDVQVSAIGAAKTLQGGRLFITPLQGPSPNLRQVFALASGMIELPDIKNAPVRGIIRRGAVMERDIIHNYVQDGSITLVIEDVHTSWSMAHAIAQIINESLSIGDGPLASLARAVDAKNVVVSIPEFERGDPARFIASIESLDLLMPAGEARIVINRTRKTIVVTGDVEIAPVVFAQDGMTIETARPAPQGTPDNPVVTLDTVAALDTAGRNSAKLTDLLSALNRLRVPAEKMIDLIETMHRSGHINAKLIHEE